MSQERQTQGNNTMPIKTLIKGCKNTFVAVIIVCFIGAFISQFIHHEHSIYIFMGWLICAVISIIAFAVFLYSLRYTWSDLLKKE